MQESGLLPARPARNIENNKGSSEMAALQNRYLAPAQGARNILLKTRGARTERAALSGRSTRREGRDQRIEHKGVRIAALRGACAGARALLEWWG